MKGIFFVALFVVASFAQTMLNDPSLQSFSVPSVQLTFQPPAKSAQFTLIPCSGSIQWEIGTSENSTSVIACDTLSADQMCRYQYSNTLPLGDNVYMTISSRDGTPAVFDFVASSSLTYFDSITPPVFTTVLIANAYFLNETQQYGNITWPELFESGTGATTTYALYSLSVSSPSQLASNQYINTTCGIKNFMTLVPSGTYTQTTFTTTPNGKKTTNYQATKLPLDPTMYTYYAVVATRVDPGTTVYSAPFPGTWIAPNSAAPFVKKTGSSTGSAAGVIVPGEDSSDAVRTTGAATGSSSSSDSEEGSTVTSEDSNHHSGASALYTAQALCMLAITAVVMF